MGRSNKKLIAAVEAYFTDLRRVRASGGATSERSSYGPLAGLLDAVGATLRPKVFCIQELADQGAGHPDFGLYAGRQVQKGRAREGQLPERGVVEVKTPDEDASVTAKSDQVRRYRSRCGLVLVTNTHEFVLVGGDEADQPAKLESFKLAANADDFERRLQRPRVLARDVGAGLGEYLARALSHRAALAEPKDLAWLLASYARDGLSRVEAAGDSPSLRVVRNALEDALGVRFEGDRGTAFFRSTLVQTLFYGVFSAWVLWARQTPTTTGRFHWREAVWYLRAPVLRALFQQLSDPGRLQPLGLVEVLDWSSAALDRVERGAFFSRFDQGEAVPYFYEPFLAAFDPELRKQLGVWYTPSEVVRYMVARVDKALKDDLDVPDGLAGENVYVLDPCCGTGAYLAEVLRRIASNLEGQGFGALTGARVKRAATERVFGFEIMPAPFVVAHLQVGLTLQELDAPLADSDIERAGVFLTNALTGWEPTEKEKQLVAFPELEEERDRAERVKRDTPILVILGNPPYNGYAGVAVDEERDLTDAYRETQRVRSPEGRGLNDPYVRFFRMAERRIAEKTGQGVICFISNYGWLDGLSFTGMRERYLDSFDAVRIDCLNGDKRKTGKIAPDGSPDPSIFSTSGDLVGIQVGTAIATLVRKADHVSADAVGFRHLWGQAKPAELIATAESEPNSLYEQIEPVLPLGLPFVRATVSSDWFAWPTLPELFPAWFQGSETDRDAFLIDIDLCRLKERIADYFDPHVSHEEMARRYPVVMKDTARFDARVVRDTLIARGGPDEDGFVRHAYRPFDDRWLYWEGETKLLREKSPHYPTHVIKGNLWVAAARHLRRGADEPQACFTRHLASRHLIERGTSMFPAWLRDDVLQVGTENGEIPRTPNLSASARRYLQRLGVGVDDLFFHVVATLHEGSYLEVNAVGLQVGWPRIPLPGWPDTDTSGAAARLSRSAARGRELAALFDIDSPVPGVTSPPLRSEVAILAVPSTVDGRNMSPVDFAVEAGWGRVGAGDAVMPGTGKVVEREYSPEEHAAMGGAVEVLGESTFDVYLSGSAFWSNVPGAVWGYKLGGYQVLKKWLSYREQAVLGRSLRLEEIQRFCELVRRIAAVLTLTRSEVAEVTGSGGE